MAPASRAAASSRSISWSLSPGITGPIETQTGKVFRLRDKGVKSVRSRHPGDLYCKVVVETPVNLTAEQRELLERFEATFTGENARRHSPKSSTFLDGVKGFWDRMVS